MRAEDKITPSHRTRKAVVYVRQSSEAQVRHNLESQDLQYALQERAKDLGFKNIEVIDCDLGKSASLGANKRAGFERLLAMVALGEVGLILSREISRLARTDKDWCHLLELVVPPSLQLRRHQPISRIHFVELLLRTHRLVLQLLHLPPERLPYHILQRAGLVNRFQAGSHSQG